MVDALIYEIELQKDYLGGEEIQSVYFGGGTPSLLEEKDLRRIFDEIHKYHTVSEEAEITLEANPDDLTSGKLSAFRQTPINRLSIGIQSFFDEDLEFMNRAHNAVEATKCIDLAREAGFDNLTIDLIYGAPTTTQEMWKFNIEKTIELQVEHLSCYCLTVEPGTALDHFVRKGKAEPVDQKKAAQQFEYLTQRLTTTGYLHYEISNFGLPNYLAVHNSNYWKGAKYLGIGPSAHSFNGHSRQWNVANNSHYLKSIRQGNIPFEKEILSPADQYNEYVMTGLRTMWGIQKEKIRELGFNTHFEEKIQSYIKEELVQKKEDHFILTQKGKLLADRIAMELFVDG